MIALQTEDWSSDRLKKPEKELGNGHRLTT
jgi:hypothetical protein